MKKALAQWLYSVIKPHIVVNAWHSPITLTFQYRVRLFGETVGHAELSGDQLINHFLP